MAKPQFKYGLSNVNRRVRVTRLRTVLPRHHMGRVNRAPVTRPIEGATVG